VLAAITTAPTGKSASPMKRRMIEDSEEEAAHHRGRTPSAGNRSRWRTPGGPCSQIRQTLPSPPLLRWNRG